MTSNRYTLKANWALAFTFIFIIITPTLTNISTAHFAQLGSVLKFGDKIFLALLLCFSAIQVVKSRALPQQAVYAVCYLAYAILLAIKNNLPSTSYLQIILDARIYVYGLSLLYIARVQESFAQTATTIFKVCLAASIPFNFALVLDPQTFNLLMGIADQTRADELYALSGYFTSRVAYAQFLVIAGIHLSFFTTGRSRMKLLVLVGSLLFFTFSRKEIIYFLFIVPAYFALRSRHAISARTIIVSITLALLLAINLFLTLDVTMYEMGSDYVRLQILDYAIDILKDNFPFGTGPGTFGSIMSLEYTKVYNEYGVADRIVYGYGLDGFDRGPIFDLFLGTLTTEYGIGTALFFLFIFSFRITKPGLQLHPELPLMLFFLLYSSLLTPAFNTITCFIVFMSAVAMRKHVLHPSNVNSDRSTPFQK